MARKRAALGSLSAVHSLNGQIGRPRLLALHSRKYRAGSWHSSTALRRKFELSST